MISPSPSTPTDPTQGALALLAGDSTLLSDLSPPVRAMAGALDTGLGLAAGLGQDLSAAGVGAISNLASSVVASLGGAFSDIVTEVASEVPLIGGILSIFASLFGSLGVDNAAACQQLFQTYQPTPSGSMFAGGTTVPADIFAREHRVQPFSGDTAEISSGIGTIVPLGSGWCVSAPGMAWMQVTEGYPVDPADLDWPHIHAALLAGDLSDAQRGQIPTPLAVRRLWDASLARDVAMAPRQYAAQNPQAVPVGLPAQWITRFRVLRRAIAAAKRTTFSTAPSDGGASLYMLYADLIAAAFDRGYLTPSFARFLFARQFGPEILGVGVGVARFPPRYAISPFWIPRYMLGPLAVQHVALKLFAQLSDGDLLGDPQLTAAPATWIWFADPCPSMVVDMLEQQVTTWEHSVHPVYSQGQSATGDMEARARQAARRAVAKRAQRSSVLPVVAGVAAAAVGVGLVLAFALRAPPPPPAPARLPPLDPHERVRGLLAGR
jgi:hypothetical protein